MTHDNKLLLQILGQAFERKEARDGALKTTYSDRKSIVTALAQVFDQQLVPAPENGHPGAEFYEAFMAWDGYFSGPHPTEAELEKVVALATVDYHAFIVIRLASQLFPDSASAVLKDWRQNEYLGTNPKPRPPSGPRRFKNAQRDMLIVSQIRLLEAAGIRPTRDQTQEHRNTGCDLVAEAMSSRKGRRMTYDAVERVWKKRKSQVFPQQLGLVLAAAITASTHGSIRSD